MKKVLITGASGFVGKHLIACLLEDEAVQIVGTMREEQAPPRPRHPRLAWMRMELTDPQSVRDVLQRVQPDEVYHLAGQANVRAAWDHKAETLASNVLGSVHLFDAILAACPQARVLSVGSSEEYGMTDGLGTPIDESRRPNPTNPYGVSKLSVSMLAMQYAKSHGLRCLHVRPFNHIGPGQSTGFVTADFAKQIVSIERGLQPPVIAVGNLEAARDFTDVRDIVRAYRDLVRFGESGQIYNVCSSRAVRIRTVLDELVAQSRDRGIEVVVDAARLRPLDVPMYVGDHAKLAAATGWSPAIAFTQTLSDILEDWRQRPL